MKTDKNNQRKYARAICCTEADACTDTGDFKCLTLNLTPDGMLIRTDEKLRLGQEISVAFRLPESDEEISATGNVVRLVGNCAGIRFDEPLQVFLAV